MYFQCLQAVHALPRQPSDSRAQLYVSTMSHNSTHCSRKKRMGKFQKFDNELSIRVQNNKGNIITNIVWLNTTDMSLALS